MIFVILAALVLIESALILAINAACDRLRYRPNHPCRGGHDWEFYPQLGRFFTSHRCRTCGCAGGINGQWEAPRPFDHACTRDRNRDGTYGCQHVGRKRSESEAA